MHNHVVFLHMYNYNTYWGPQFLVSSIVWSNIISLGVHRK